MKLQRSKWLLSFLNKTIMLRQKEVLKEKGKTGEELAGLVGVTPMFNNKHCTSTYIPET